MDLGAGLQKCKRVLYRGPVEAFFRRTGLELPMARVYTALLRRTENDTITYEIDGRSATFRRSPYLPESIPERPVVADVLGAVRPDDVFYDIGANNGIYTCLVGDALSEGQVVAFEPEPQTADNLAENVALNGLGERVTTYQVAVADESTQADFFVPTDATGSSLVASGEGDGTKRISVDVVALDSFCDEEGLPLPDVVKLDVEGAEPDALRGMRSMLRADDGPRIVYCEIHEDVMADAESGTNDVGRLLRDAGFETSVIYERTDDHYILKATR